jgi:hypothetical protein
MAELSKFTVVTYERKPGHWRAAVTPVRRPNVSISSKETASIVTPDDFSSEADARVAAEKMIKRLPSEK